MLRSKGRWSESPLDKYVESKTSDIMVGFAKARSIREDVLYVVEKQE